jgi:hypothetical protein
MAKRARARGAPGSLLRVVGRCADCVVGMGLQDDRAEYEAGRRAPG